MLTVEPDMEVVGQACDGAEAVEMAQQLHPDVVLMDLHMPRMGGVAATRAITLSLPRTHVLVLTTLDAEETVFEAIRAGAHAYLLKDATEEELLETVRAVHRGESRLTPQIARKVMDQFRRLEPLNKLLKYEACAHGQRHGRDAQTDSSNERIPMKALV